MLNKELMDELAARVKFHGAYKISELSGVNLARVSRFQNNPQVVTMRELDLIKKTIARLDNPA
jgi:phage terminase Nu1 subunit (DNA packaging protein)